MAAPPGSPKEGKRIAVNLRIPGGPRTIALVGVASVAGVLLWLRSPLSMPPASQPVAFNHRRHTQDLKIDCSMCHKYVNTGAHAGLPDGQTCKMCHQVQQGTSPEAARLTTLLTRGDVLQFNKLFRLPPHVRFTHRRHVGLAKLPCQDCHGAIADTDRPPARPLKIIRMQVCLDCHRASGQTQDCVECHR